MSINFNILWFEDETHFVGSLKPNIEKLISVYHFNPIIKAYEHSISEDELRALQKDMSNIQLILTDYKLDGTTGTKVAKFIRDNNILSDVLLYSGNINNIHDNLRENSIEGIYVSSRDSSLLLDKIDKLIKKGVNRMETTPQIRHSIINYVGENDIHIREILKNYHEDMDINKYLLDKLKQGVFEDKKRIKKLSEEIDKGTYILQDILNKPGVVDSQKLATLLHKIDKEFKLEGYKTEILRLRNEFAHNAEKEFSQEECNTLRQNMKKYSEQINSQRSQK